MPRRNSDPDKSGSSRPGRKSGPRRDNPKVKSQKRGSEDRRASADARSFAKKTPRTSSRTAGRTSAGEKFFKKDDSPRRSYGKPARPSSSKSSERESFSQRSRFAKRDDKRDAKRDDKRDAKPSSRNPEHARSGRRTDSFGKPFKKNYRARPDRPQTSTRRRKVEDVPASKSDKIRLNKFIANSGVSSRREADELIKMGLISVNGNVVTELGHKVNPGDEVRYESKVLRAERPVYILMNKPKGFLTTTDDPQERKTVMHIIGAAVKERIYPVGRLDRNTTGLLLLTNDGDLADKLMHPSFNVKKVYKVELDRPLTKADFQAVVDGVRLEEGRAVVDDLAIVSEDSRTVGIELHIGWNRVVRRIFESLGYDVMKLDRTAYAGLDKKELSRGQWRFLTREEIIHLKHFK